MVRPLTTDEAEPSRIPTSGRLSTSALDRVKARIIAFILDGLAHGHFDLHITGEIINGDRRRLTVWFGKTHQFVIPKDECEPPGTPRVDSRHGSDLPSHDKDAAHRWHDEPATGSVPPPVRGARVPTMDEPRRAGLPPDRPGRVHRGGA
jgi:hypothetical protein